MHRKHRQQYGVALITALLIVAIATVAAVSMASRQQLDIRRTASLLHSEQAWAYVLGAEDWASAVLRRDRKDSEIDTLEEDWSTQLPASIVEGGFITGRILDLQGYFNVNSLVQNGETNASALALYKRLLRRLELDESLADALVDWIDADIDTRFPDGAEDEHYLLLDTPYRVANQPLVEVSELRLVKGYSTEVVAKLRPFVTALPAVAPINVNTASAELLSSIAEELELKDGENLLEARGDGGFASVDSFLQHEALAGQKIEASLLSVASDWFLVISEADIGQGRARLASLVQRNDDGLRVIRRQREFVNPIVVQSDDDDE